MCIRLNLLNIVLHPVLLIQYVLQLKLGMLLCRIV